MSAIKDDVGRWMLRLRTASNIIIPPPPAIPAVTAEPKLRHCVRSMTAWGLAPASYMAHSRSHRPQTPGSFTATSSPQNLQAISRDVLREKYLKPGETSQQDVFHRVARALASAEQAADRGHYEARSLDNPHVGTIGAGRIILKTPVGRDQLAFLRSLIAATPPSPLCRAVRVPWRHRLPPHSASAPHHPPWWAKNAPNGVPMPSSEGMLRLLHPVRPDRYLRLNASACHCPPQPESTGPFRTLSLICCAAIKNPCTAPKSPYDCANAALQQRFYRTSR